MLAELRDVVARKFPKHQQSTERFIREMLSVVDVVAAGYEPSPGESVVRDQQDWPIIRAAHGGGCDVIITGDHDLLDAGLRHPRAVSPGAWLAGEQARP